MTPNDSDLSGGGDPPACGYLSVKEYARRTGISEKTARRYLKAGRLRGHQPGGRNCRVTIPPDALAAAPSLPGGVPAATPPPAPATPGAEPPAKARKTERPLPVPPWKRKGGRR